MVRFIPETGVDPRDLFESIAEGLVEQYSAAEARVLAELSRRILYAIDQRWPYTHATDRQLVLLAQIRELRAAVEAQVGKIDQDASDAALRIAITEGQAAAAARVNLITPAARFGPLSTDAPVQLVQLALDLRSRLDDVKARITRFPQDAYQQVVADQIPGVILGQATTLEAQRAAVASWLEQGIPGFVDAKGRQWSVGSYVEMATRTAVSRGYTEAGAYRQMSLGVPLVTPVVGIDACKGCAQWSGKILSLDGTTGNITVGHAITGEPVTVFVADSVAHARATSHYHGPNCRCVDVAYQPGLSMPAGTTYDPDREAARERQRALERSLRQQKRRAALLPGDEGAAARARIRATQAKLRAHIDEHGLPRKRNREDPAFQYGPSRAAAAA